MKDEILSTKRKKHRFSWVLDETKYLNLGKVEKLRSSCEKEKEKALKKNEIISVRNWSMVEIGLFTGLRVDEMVNLKKKISILMENNPL